MFYLIEVAIGDDNDQSISDLVLYANTKERVIDAIDLHFKQELTVEDFDHDSVERDGDGSSHVGHLWYEDDIPYHADYYIRDSFTSLDEAVAARSRYHGWLGAFGYESRDPDGNPFLGDIERKG